MMRSAVTASPKPPPASVPCIVSMRIMISMLFLLVRGVPGSRRRHLPTAVTGSVAAEVGQDGNNTAAATGGLAGAVANDSGLAVCLAGGCIPAPNCAARLERTAAGRSPRARSREPQTVLGSADQRTCSTDP